ncbi:MAG TPA: FkbM family methyltransferase [Vicinamibacteria bacterium]|nr:FkbM family methyltransferase [Vicinamibacteria bacterium]
MLATAKALLRDILPPALLRLLTVRRGDVAPKEGSECSVAITGGGRGKLILNSQVPFFHRHTRADLGVIEQVFQRREYWLGHLQRDVEIRAFYKSCPDPLIIDCGANIGATSAWFALDFPRCRVLAIEPEEGNFVLLERNASSLSAVLPIKAGVASRPGALVVSDPGLGEWAYRTSLAQPTTAGNTVPAVTVSGLLREHRGNPFILKIDVEGAEKDLFSEEDPAFDLFPVIVIEFHDWMFPKEAMSRNFLRWHSSRNRDFVVIGENAFSISNEIRAGVTGNP